MLQKFPILFFLVIFISFCSVSCTETPIIENPDDELEPVKSDNKIRIFITSSLASSFDSFPAGKDSQKMVGGLARIMTILESKRAENIPSITISNGNDVGGEIFDYFYGVATMQILKAMKYDLICPGIAEFSMGEVILAAALRDVNFELVLSNAIFANRGIKRKIKKHIIKEIDGCKVGFFGLIDPKIKDTIKLADGSMIFDDLKIISETEVLQLQSEGAEIICAISNLSGNSDIEIAKNVSGIDIIFNSDEIAENVKIVLNSTTTAETTKTWETMIVNCKKFGTYLGVLDLTFEKTDGSAKIIGKSFENLPITASIPENSAIKDKINEYLTMLPAE